jgi:hypothetical protein
VAVKLSVVGALASACVKVPPFQHQDAAPGDADGDAPTDANEGPPAISIVQDSMGVLVTAPGYTVRFGTDGALFPYQLVAGGQHLMGGSQQCADEQAMGIALYPVFRAGSTDFPGQGAPSIAIPLEGPYVGQVRLTWSGAYACSPGNGSISGQSTFSFFPDGRLTRFDVITNDIEKNSVDCTRCDDTGPATSFYLTTFTTLVVDPGAFLSDGTEAMLDSYGEQVSPGQTACVRERGQAVAFSWVDTQTRMRVVNTAPTRSIAFVKDFVSGAATLPPMDWRTTTQMGISATENCAALEARIQRFSDADHELVINGNSVGAALTDGIFGGDPRPEGYPVDFPVTITPAQTVAPNVPAGFAVWLYSNPIPTSLTVTHSGGHTGTWYRMQRVGSTQLVLWFDVPLDDGETITISEP